MATVPPAAGAQPVSSVVDALNATSASAKTTSTADQTEDRFLKLLVAQMNNQDPLNPLDNSQVTSQLAQINTVRGIEQLNSTLSKFVSSQGATRAIDDANLIGRNVLVDGNTLTLGDGATADARVGASVASDAAKVSIDVLDASGATVRTLDLGAQPAGVATATWDGKTTAGARAPAGKYTLRVTALDGAGKAVDAVPLVTDSVAGATQAGDASRLALVGGASVAPTDVRGIFQP